MPFYFGFLFIWSCFYCYATWLNKKIETLALNGYAYKSITTETLSANDDHDIAIPIDDNVKIVIPIGYTIGSSYKTHLNFVSVDIANKSIKVHTIENYSGGAISQQYTIYYLEIY